jgi:hypothetical protein
MSTGWAMYPVPPQRGQFFGSTHPPQLAMSFSPIAVGGGKKVNCVTKPEHGRRVSGCPGAGAPEESTPLGRADQLYTQSSQHGVFIR